MREVVTQQFGVGVHNLMDAELIPQPAAQDSLNWESGDGFIALGRGKQRFGADETGTSFVKGLHVGYKADGTAVYFRKINTVIQYATTALGNWTNVITGLTATAEYTFSNYTSLAGAMVYITGADGIYKIMTANPGSFTTLYNSAKNFKGYSIIDRGRMFMWNLSNDKTGLYGSYIDAQNSTVYTTVAGEVIADTATGTLAFKGAGATRTCFGVSITDTSSGEVFTDNYNGVLTGSLGGSGTINYTSGAFTTSQSGAGTASYQWEDSNALGVTDFTKSSPRTAGQGFIFRQDYGGDAIQNVLVQDGKYYSVKQRSIYELDLTADDTNATNNVFRTDIGVPYWRATITTSNGLMLMDVSNPSKPVLSIIQRDITGTTLRPYVLAPQFDFSQYYFDACAMISSGENIVFSGRTLSSSINNRLFIYNTRRQSLDVRDFSAKVFAKESGNLYMGDALSENVYHIFSGFDDDTFTIENAWTGKDDTLGIESLKREKWLVVRGTITRDQTLQVYVSYDNDDFSLVGTVVGTGEYVDLSNPITIGSSGIGVEEIGGGGSGATAYRYMTAFKMSTPKYRTRTIKFVATTIGYVSVDTVKDNNIYIFANKLPSRYRVKQNVNLAGTVTDQATP